MRCSYCMPKEEMQFMPSGNLMNANEVENFAKIFVGLGVNKIRLTGGEPLVRKDAGEIIRRLGKLSIELTLTTNGVFIDRFVDQIIEAGISSVNLSIDSLQRKRFFEITQRDSFDKVWANIQLLIKNNFHLKLNVVVMNGINDDEILSFIHLTKDLPLHVRFIEFMPFAGNHWESKKVFPLQKILESANEEFDVNPIDHEKNSTAKKYFVKGFAGTFAVISTMSTPFCADCNRLRLTADGKMKNCLFSKTEMDLLSRMRNGENIDQFIRECLREKEKELGGQLRTDFIHLDPEKIENRSMISIGG